MKTCAKPSLFAVCILTIVLLLSSATLALNYAVSWNVIPAGGTVGASESFTLSTTIGQPAAGFSQSVTVLQWAGFWSGGIPMRANITEAKMQVDGMAVSTVGKIATSATGDFDGFFYIEEPGRWSGIRVAISPSTVLGLTRGSVVNVIGTMSTTPAGERQISDPVVIVTSAAIPLTPLGVDVGCLGGGDLGNPPLGQYGVTGRFGTNNVGLLVRTWGMVTATGSGYVMIDGGGGTVKLDTSALSFQPDPGYYLLVTGVSSVYTSGSRMSVILPRQDDDVNGFKITLP